MSVDLSRISNISNNSNKICHVFLRGGPLLLFEIIFMIFVFQLNPQISWTLKLLLQLQCAKSTKNNKTQSSVLKHRCQTPSEHQTNIVVLKHQETP